MEHRSITYPGVAPGVYMITEFGDIIDLDPSPFNPMYKKIRMDLAGFNLVSSHVHPSGYVKVSLKVDRNLYPNRYIKTFPLHRLVAWEFCIGRDMRLTVDHNDSDKLNNHYSNLEWVTAEENLRRKYLRDSKKGGYFKSDQQIRDLCEIILENDPELTHQDMCRLVGLDLSYKSADGLCNKLITGNCWKHVTKDYDFSQLPPRHNTISDEHKMAVAELLMKGLDSRQAYEVMLTMPFPIMPYHNQFASLCQRLRRKYNIPGTR